MAEGNCLFRGPSWGLWFLLQSIESGSQNCSAEQTLEEKPVFRASLQLLSAYRVLVVVT